MAKRDAGQRFSRQGFSLIEILVVVLLLAALGGGAAYFYTGRSSHSAKAATPITRAESTVCMSNLTSVRQSISAAQAGETDGKFPASLAELKLPAEVLICAVGHEPYAYDPTTGTVHCVHPGHENY